MDGSIFEFGSKYIGAMFGYTYLQHTDDIALKDVKNLKMIKFPFSVPLFLVSSLFIIFISGFPLFPYFFRRENVEYH
jgi:hypothetical protein